MSKRFYIELAQHITRTTKVVVEVPDSVRGSQDLDPLMVHRACVAAGLPYETDTTEEASTFVLRGSGYTSDEPQLQLGEECVDLLDDDDFEEDYDWDDEDFDEEDS